ncbi:TrbG/VirB9 family P-type conjugative transfer protein [Sphingosinicella sp. BN140058]|uniref:TrbG/VirB9 family P-type conjugative transfer protein n=1 Tax=Sphingosinicella sp. BN140058 TaxID=1892855 RepID=UPI001013A56C|nr:TrbG/VirB9 family P-type conjugative transfer protein [Sphingosinicella sp. BN140058]QAY80213.1 hypothetical protein ETR14_26585 [Sphingosinicella sp. BN140058]
MARKIILTAIVSAMALSVAAPAVAAPSKQQKAQAAGDYGTINDSYLEPVGAIQNAWSNPGANKAANQESPGYNRFEFRPDRVIPLRLREAMNTTIRFPADEIIEDVFNSDPVSFEAIIPRSNVVMIRVIRPGADGNLIAMGKSGNLYQFYIRGEGANTKIITDMSVDIMVTGRGNGMPANMGGLSRTASASDLKVESDWLRTIGFKPENIVHDLSIFVPEDHSAGVAPERVFRDGQFTYIDYGSNADALNEWPVASLVVQGVETPVNVRTAGPNGRMLVVEGVGDIVLRNGQKLVCIKRQTNRPPQIRSFNQPVTTPQATLRVADGQVLPPSLSSPSTGRKYMVDLGAGDRPSMEKTFLTIKAQNASLLSASEASFPDATSLRTGGTLDANARPGDVRLRVGPFYGLSEGVAVCKAMTASGRSCSVVSVN